MANSHKVMWLTSVMLHFLFAVPVAGVSSTVSATGKVEASRSSIVRSAKGSTASAVDAGLLAASALAAAQSRLWSGEDLSDYEVDLLDSQPKHVQHFDFTRTSRDDTPVVIRVIGMFGSGTNLMVNLLNQNGFTVYNPTKLNISPELENEWCPLEVLQQKQFSVRKKIRMPSCSIFWKHTAPLRLLDWHKKHPLHIVAMVRNPMTQFLSWKRTPFNIYGCFGDNPDPAKLKLKGLQYNSSKVHEPCWCESTDYGATTIHGACSHPGDYSGEQRYNFFSDPLPNGTTRLADRPPSPYKNVMDVWNEYTKGYKHLDDNGPLKLHVVRYEDVVTKPENIINDLAKKVGLQAKSGAELRLVEENARTFEQDKENARTKAIEEIHSRSYREEFEAGQLAKLCNDLDSTMLDALEYSDECKSPA